MTTFNRLEELSADATQLRGTLRALVAAQNGDVTAETVATLNGLTQRIDTRLGEVQANVQGCGRTSRRCRSDWTRASRGCCFAFNLLALLSTLMLTWIVYTQIVVIRHHWTRVRRPAARPLTNGSKVSSTATPPT